MRKDEREFLDTRFNDLKDHFTVLFKQNSDEHTIIQKQVSKNTKFRLVSTGVVITITFLIGSYGFFKFVFGGN